MKEETAVIATEPVIQVLRSGGIPREMEESLQAGMGVNEANIVLKEIQSLAAVRSAEPGISSSRTNAKPPTIANTDIDIRYGYYPRTGSDHLTDIRRETAIGYEDIELMQRCGIMVFASRLKKSSIITSLANPRYWRIQSPDEQLGLVVEANLIDVFQRHADDMLLSLDYGNIFMAKQWIYKTAEEIGVESDKVPPGSKWWVIDKLHTVAPWTVPEILRNRDTLEFKGFVHERNIKKSKPVEIKVPQALVMSYNEMFGNIWGQSIFEPVYDYWFWYEVAMRAFMRYLERMGTPVAVCKAPSRGTVQRPDGSIVNNADWAMLVAGNAGHSSALYIPSDVDINGQPMWSLEYLSADQRGEQFVKALEMLGTWIMRGMIVGDRAATQGSDVGSYSAALVHSGYTELDNDLIYKGVVGQINRWLMPDYGRYNISPTAPPPVHLKTEGLDPREKERIMTLVATAGNQKLGAGSPFDLLDWRTMFQAVDLPTLTEEERQEMLEQMTDEAIDKQKQFNDLQAEQMAKMPQGQGQPAGANPMKKPSVDPGGKPAANAQQKLFEAMAEGYSIPMVMSPHEAQMMLGEGEYSDPFGSRPIVLFNPNHDKAGRFASGTGKQAGRAKDWIKAHKKEIAIGTAVVGTAAVFAGTAYVVSKSPSFMNRSGATLIPSDSSGRDVFWNSKSEASGKANLRANLDDQEAFLKEKLSGFEGKSKVYVDDYWGPYSKTVGGSYSPRQDRISLSSRLLHEDQDLFYHNAMHESVHSRKTKKGVSPPQREASTEMIARKLYKDMYGEDSRSRSYNRQVSALSNYAKKAHPNDSKSAWGLVNRLNTGDAHMPTGAFEDAKWEPFGAWNWLLENAKGIELAEVYGSADVYTLLYAKDYERAFGLAAETMDAILIGEVLETAAYDGVYFEPEDGFDLSEILLFNPFHDKTGRFASGTSKKAGRAKDWVKAHKKEIAIGAGVATAVGVAGITAYAVNKRKNGTKWEANVVGDKWTGKVGLESSGFGDALTANESERFLHGVSVAQSAVAGVGANPDATATITGHTNWEKYSEEYLGQARTGQLIAQMSKQEGSAIGKRSDLSQAEVEDLLAKSRKLPQGFARLEDKTAFLSPQSTRRIVDDMVIQGMNPDEMPGYRRGVKTAMHELIHTREASQGFNQTGFGSSDDALRKQNFMEEGLTDWTTGDALKNTFPGIKTDRFLTYKSQAKAVSRAAWSKSQQENKSVIDVRSEWLGMKNPYDDIAKWLESRGTQFSEEEAGIQLFNPYHDKGGRFTHSPGGLKGLDRVGVGRVLRGPRDKATMQPSVSGSKRPVGFTARAREGERARVRKELDAQEKHLKENLSGFKGDAPVFVENYKFPMNHMLAGYYNSQSHEMSLSRRNVKHMGKKRGDASSEHVAIHESVHTRRGINRSGSNTQTRESSTELISRRMTNQMYGKYPKGYYSQPTAQLGNYAMKRSNGNTKSAWSYVNSVHRGRTKPPIWIYDSWGLSRGDDWVKMVETNDRINLSEAKVEGIELEERIGDVVMPDGQEQLEFEAYRLMGQEQWQGAMQRALEHGGRELIHSIAEAAAHEGVFFTDGMEDTVSTEPSSE